MPENQNAAVHIGQLNLRIPGQRAETARSVASGVAQSLAQRVPAGMRRRLGALGVRVPVPAAATEAAMGDAAAEAILRALRK
jgi:hypothetical protein